MFSFDKSDFQRLAVSAVGALLLSATCIVSAVGPAKAAEVSAITDHQFVAGGASQLAAR